MTAPDLSPAELDELRRFDQHPSVWHTEPVHAWLNGYAGDAQPERLLEDTTGLPDVAGAAARVAGFLRAYGDGVIGVEPAGDTAAVLYARDLEALVKHRDHHDPDLMPGPGTRNSPTTTAQHVRARHRGLVPDPPLAGYPIDRHEVARLGDPDQPIGELPELRGFVDYNPEAVDANLRAFVEAVQAPPIRRTVEDVDVRGDAL